MAKMLIAPQLQYYIVAFLLHLNNDEQNK
jgi:hypothetical protein